MRRVQIVQHVIAAFLLVNAGIEHGAHSPLAIAEIIAGGLLIVSVLRERRRGGHHEGIAWVELAGAAMVAVEAVEKTKGPHHVSFVILAFVQPLILFLFAMFDAQITHARYLKADDDGLEMRLRLLFRRRIPWASIRSFSVQGSTIVMEGARNLRLRDIVDRNGAVQWTVEQLRRRGIPQSAAHEPPGREGDAGEREEDRPAILLHDGPD
jgi:hypothetical protein